MPARSTQGGAAPAGAAPPGAAGRPPGDEVVARGSASAEIWTKLGRFSILGLFLGMLLVFSLLKPDNFPTFDNTKAILQQAAILAVLGAGLTVVLVIREFDLSFDANAALSGAIAVQVMVNLEMSMALGVLAGILTGAIVGIANGTIVAYGKAPAFIGTLAVAAVAGGVESMITKDATVFGVPESYLSIATSQILGIPLLVWISVAVVLVIGGLLKYTVFGRHAHAVGSNAVAASAAGIRTKEVRWSAFVVLGALAGLAGVLITAQAGGSAPNNAANLLLPVYTAAFLGASALGRGSFNSVATYFGVIFIGTLQTGLTMLSQPAWIASVITGVVLVAAVLIARRQ
jgi:ribose/xylose/arabinose/galactoside ABC-type transport system permease subunit